MRILFSLLITAYLVVISHHQAKALDYPVYSKVLSNGLKVIVCEKPTNSMVMVQLWYRVGSKDETDGIRGMAHMFEHMMFRGSKKYPGEGDVFFDSIVSFGGTSDAYTDFDRTVYYETVPSSKLINVLSMEADRMSNLVLNQRTLDVERQVVGEELRNGQNNWYRNAMEAVYEKQYPEGHPYRVDVIGYLPQIVNFTTEQCQMFYDKFYSPNNAVLIIVGNLNKDDAFEKAEKAFGGVTKQIHADKKKNIPDIFSDSLRQYEFQIDFPVQIYEYAIPKPAADNADIFPFLMLKDLLFTNPNSILNNKLVKNMQLAYNIADEGADMRLYTSYCDISIIMDAQPGNAKVKKIVSSEIRSIIEDGIDEQLLNDYVSNIRAQFIINSSSSEFIASELGIGEMYFNDYNRYDEILKQFEKVKPEQLQAIAKKYFNPDALKIVNIKPAF